MNLPHFFIKSQGYLKIQQAHISDAGIYTCIVGQAREHFVLQIVGNKQKLTVPDSWLLESGRQKAKRPVTTSTKESSMELPISLNKYDDIVEHLLNLKGSIHNEKYLADTTYSREMNRLTLEDEITESSIPAVLAIDGHKLDELMHNLSEGFRESQEEPLLKLLTESTNHSLDSAESSTQGLLLYKLNLKTHTSRARKPVIIQRPKKVGTVPQSEIVVDVGVPVLLQKPVASLELRCEALGDPRSTLTWTKNEKVLRYDGR